MLVIVVVPQSHTGDREWSVEIYNSTAHDVTYWLFYVDHPFQKQWPRPMNIAGGGIEPGKTWEWKQKWGTGRYFVLLRLGEREGFVPFIVDEDILSVRIEIPSLTVAYETGKRT